MSTRTGDYDFGPGYDGPPATTYYGEQPPPKKKRRFPWAVLFVLCVLAVALVLSLAQCGIEDTHPYLAPKPPQYTSTSIPVATTVPAITHETVVRTG